MQNLDKVLQLHEVIEIHYYVDHIGAQLYTADGNRLVLEGFGDDSIENAIADLNRQCEGLSVYDIRRLPAISSKAAYKTGRD